MGKKSARLLSSGLWPATCVYYGRMLYVSDVGRVMSLEGGKEILICVIAKGQEEACLDEERRQCVQDRAKLIELSLVTHVPSGPIGCAWAGHFAWQK